MPLVLCDINSSYSWPTDRLRLLEKSSPQPLYVQLAGILREAIAAGDLAAGERIPTTAELAAEYEVGHRMNVTLRAGEVFTRYWQPIGDSEDYWRPASNKSRPVDIWDLGKQWTQQKGGGLRATGPKSCLPR